MILHVAKVINQQLYVFKFDIDQQTLVASDIGVEMRMPPVQPFKNASLITFIECLVI